MQKKPHAKVAKAAKSWGGAPGRSFQVFAHHSVRILVEWEILFPSRPARTLHEASLIAIAWIRLRNRLATSRQCHNRERGAVLLVVIVKLKIKPRPVFFLKFQEDVSQ